VLRESAKKLVGALAQKLGIRVAPVTHARKVEAFVNPEHAAEDVAHGAPLQPKAIVRVVPAQRDTWIKKL
jgi:hypothetical protein